MILALRVAVVALLVGVAGAALAQGTPALQALTTFGPDVEWEAASEVTADVDCDGRADQALVGRRDGRIFVGLVVSSKARPEILTFAVGAKIPDAICAEPAVLQVESLDYTPKKSAGRIDGFRRSKRCKGLRLSGGACDSIHFFWNHKTGELDWWRL